MHRPALPLALMLLAGQPGCGTTKDGDGQSASTQGDLPDGGSRDGGPPSGGHFCDLPGSARWTSSGVSVVPGDSTSPDVDWMQLPEGFCAHYFGNVGNARQLRFAPGGELFVASPTEHTTSGGSRGEAAIVVLADDDRDGLADEPRTFLGNLPATQGLLFNHGYLYYQDSTKILRVPYATGDREPSGNAELVANITIYSSNLHWPKTMDVADDGTIYVTNGGDQGEACDTARPFHGGILKLDGPAGGTPVTKGLRNPIGIRCERGRNLCFAVELAKDYTTTSGGREKLIAIRQGDDWGFPCCATKDTPYEGLSPTPDCSGVAVESGALTIGDTPFDLDFERGVWPAPWKNRIFIPLHGAAGSWEGARLVSIAVDEATGHAVPSSDLAGEPPGGLADFANGWDDRRLEHGRPTAVAFSLDGRLFLANNQNGEIIWIAPLEMEMAK